MSPTAPGARSSAAVAGRRYRIIRNPTAGLGGLPGGGDPAADLGMLLERHGIVADIVEPAGEEAAREAVDTAVRDGVDVVVAAGGDGTVHLVAEALLDKEQALGILPLGRVMNVARALGVPRDIEAAAHVLAHGAMRSVDVGVATTGDDRSEAFLEAGSVGLNAAIFREVARADSGDAGSIFRTIWVAIRYRPARMIVELDDDTIATRALMATASVGPYTGLGMTVAPGAQLDDGKFDVRVFRGYSKWELLGHLASIAFGRRRYAPRASTYRSATVRISSVHPLPARADHHDLGHTPVTFRTRAHALRVIAPSG